MKKTTTLQLFEGKKIHLSPVSSSYFLTSSTGRTCDQSENKQQEYSVSRSVAVCGEQTQIENEEALGGVQEKVQNKTNVCWIVSKARQNCINLGYSALVHLYG